MSTSAFDEIDYFRAAELYQDPYPYYEYLREHGPVWREPHRDVVMITGFEEAMAVYNDPETFSSCNAVSGPNVPFPVPLEGDDVSALIDAHRDALPFSDQLPSFDPPRHTAHRGLLLRLITPKRLDENEEFMWRLADRQIDEFVARGECEFNREYAKPFTLLVIADLLGVPEADHDTVRKELQGDQRPRSRTPGEGMAHKPLEFLYDRFTSYIEERRREPRDDVMTGLSTATFPDGSLPEVREVMLIAANLFTAGGETTARLLGSMLQLIGERPDLQQLLRDERERIPSFIEETVRLESPIQGEFRLSRVPTTVGGVDLPAGTTVMVHNGAANRDPRQFEDPAEFRLDRVNGRQHLGFGFGIHTCAGAPLARAEARVSLERILERMDDIRISETEHGPADNRRYHYTPIYMLRGLERLHLEFHRVIELQGEISAQDERFRDELRSWLIEHPGPAVDIATTRDEAEALRKWQRTLHEGNWVGIQWPVEHGGRGASPSQIAIYNEELARADAPPLIGRGGVSLVGPTLMSHGTDEQRRRWMPRILAGDDVWCQLFSEPGAGSDLAGLTTRAEKHGGVYLVNGQKVWSSYAQFADWAIALVRTDPSVPNHRGISMLAIPMTSKGVDVRPLRQITGKSEFNEVFLDDVEVPVENIIGPEHEGWRVTSTTLANERGASFVWKEQVLHEAAMGQLTDACASRGRLGDPHVRQRLMRSWIEVEIFRLLNARTRTRLARGEPLGPESSVVKLFWAGMSQRMYDTAIAALGPDALLMPGDDHAIDDGRWALGLLASRATSIMGGTSEIQHNIIGERLLGLPPRAESSMTADIDVLDLIDPERYARAGYPHELWTRLRAEDPVAYFAPEGYEPFWAITKHADILEISKRPLLFSSAQGITLRRAGVVFPPSEMVVMLDPPRHGPVRRVANGRFTPRAVREQSADIERIAIDVLDAAAPAGSSGQLDFVERIAAPFPLAVIAWILGVPEDDWPLLFRWTNEVIGKDDPEYRRPGETPGQTIKRARGEVYAYFRNLIDQRRLDPQDDLVSELIRGEIDGVPLTEMQLVSYCELLVEAGNETTRNAISGGVLAFSEQPDQWEKLRADPELMPTAVDEILRWASPISHFTRTATEDCEVGGTKIRAGEQLALYFASANRDEDVFDDPFAFRVDRHPNPHLAFGFGEHFCMGAQVARVELDKIFRHLLTRLESFEVAGPVERLTAIVNGSIKRLPLEYATTDTSTVE